MNTRNVMWFLVALALLASARSGAQCAAATGYVDYHVRQGDTLIGVTQRYLEPGTDWHILQEVNSVRSPTQLPPGNKLRLPLERVKRTAVFAQVVHTLGEVVLLARGNGAVRTLALGDQVAEGDIIKVGLNSYLTLHMPDRSISHVEAGSEVRVAGLCQMLDGVVHMTIMQLAKGRVESNVTHQKTGSRFEVVTPLAVAGVRGTRFGVEVLPSSQSHASDERTDVVNGVVRVSPTGTRSALTVARGQGVRIDGATGAATLNQFLDAPDLSAVPARQLSTVLMLPVTAIAGASRYRFKIATDAQFERVVVAGTERQLPIRVAGLASGTYFVAVRAEDVTGMPGMESVSEVVLRTDPAPPMLRVPESGALVMGPSVDFACTEGTRTFGYRIEVVSETTFRTMPALPQQSACRFHIAALAPGNYVWRVASVERGTHDTLEHGPWSSAHSFTVAPPLLPPGISVRQGRGDTVRLELDGGPGNHFLLQMATDEQFQHIVRQSDEDSPQVALQLKRGLTYFLRVRVVNAYGWSSEFSSTQKIAMPVLWHTGSDDGLEDGQGNLLQLDQ
jgi:hypothetical protein